MKRILSAVLTAFLLLSLTACGPKITELITKDAYEVTLNETCTVKVTVVPEEAAGVTLNWKSENEEIATVHDGVITGKSIGKTTVTVSAGDTVREFTVSVKDRPASYYLEGPEKDFYRAFQPFFFKFGKLKSLQFKEIRACHDKDSAWYITLTGIAPDGKNVSLDYTVTLDGTCVKGWYSYGFADPLSWNLAMLNRALAEDWAEKYGK